MQQTPLPMTPLESLASSAVRTAHKVRASLIVVRDNARTDLSAEGGGSRVSPSLPSSPHFSPASSAPSILLSLRAPVSLVDPRCAARSQVLTRGGSTARLVAKYRPPIPVLTVAVPLLSTDMLTWTCSGGAAGRWERWSGGAQFCG